MIDINSISSDLVLNDGGVWTASETESVSYPEHGHQHCFALEDESFWFQHRNQCIVSLINAFPFENALPFADIGGGNGVVASAIQQAGHGVILIEPGAQGAVNAKQRGIDHVICSTYQGAKLKPKSLGAIGLFDVIEHIDDDVSFLRDLTPLLSSNGKIYATVPAYQALWSAQDVSAGHFRRHTRRSIIETFNNAGYQVDYCSYFFKWLPLPIYLGRVLAYKLGLANKENATKKANRHHGVSQGISARLMAKMCAPEASKIASGQVIAFGSSCLVAASLH